MPGTQMPVCMHQSAEGLLHKDMLPPSLSLSNDQKSSLVTKQDGRKGAGCWRRLAPEQMFER
jgi:hypothetical protein